MNQYLERINKHLLQKEQQNILVLNGISEYKLLTKEKDTEEAFNLNLEV